MPKRIVLLPYKMGSQAVKALQEKLIELGQRCVRVRQDSTTYRRKLNDYLLYYGGNLTPFNRCINEQRSLASNKLRSFEAFQQANLSTVPWTSDPEVAKQWQGLVFARHSLTGHSGEGIEQYDAEANPIQRFPDAPLYTKYVKKTYECRIHIFKGKMIDAQIKRKVRDAEEVDTTVRNIHTGWVYCREDFTPTQECIDLAIQAVQAVGLDFGAVDIIYNKHYNKYYLLEVNTAPGLTGTTLTNYAIAIIEDLN